MREVSRNTCYHDREGGPLVFVTYMLDDGEAMPPWEDRTAWQNPPCRLLCLREADNG